jgi:hypothetical protein
MQFLNRKSRVLPQQASAVLASFVVIALLLLSFFLFSFPYEAFAIGGCVPTTPSLNSGTYSANVGSTFSVILTFNTANGCNGAIQNNSLGSFATTTTSSGTYVDCNGTACSGFTTSPKTATLKCEATGTFSIKGEDYNAAPFVAVYSSNSTVTCNAVATAPTVTTNSAESFTPTTATLFGAITATGGANATQNGFAYGTASNLATVISTTTLGGMSGTGSFSSAIGSLSANTTYYYRAYATNSAGTGLGSILSFITGNSTPTRRILLFEGFKIKFISGKIIINQQ